MAATPSSPETVALARRLIFVKAKIREISHETCRLLPDLQDWCGCDDVFSKGIYQIDMGNRRELVVQAVKRLEQAHSVLCDLHREMKHFCEIKGIPIPPDPTPQGGGGR